MQTGAGAILDAILDAILGFVAFDFFNGLAVVLAVVVTVVGFLFVVFLGFFVIVSFAVPFDMVFAAIFLVFLVFAVVFFVFFLTRLRGAAMDEDDVGNGGGGGEGVATDAVLSSPLQRKHSN